MVTTLVSPVHPLLHAGAQLVTPSLGNGTSPPGRTVQMLCNINGRSSFVINIYGSYDSRIVNSLGVTCSDGNFFDAGKAPEAEE